MSDHPISQRITAGKVSDAPKDKATCPGCGSPRTIRKDRGNANLGDIPCWLFSCYDCKITFTAVLISMPPGITSMNALDEEFREERKRILHLGRVRRRIAKGLPVGLRQKPRSNWRKSSDHLRVTVQVIHGTIVKPTTPTENRPATFTISQDNPTDDPMWGGECAYCSSPIRAKGLCGPCLRTLERHRDLTPLEAAS